ncbi:MAG TPA: sugar phosphate isomerase/epimerase family protein [Capsulimonadaceae bacterium]|jgi:sugar phosphate isomerase/epimerase
MNELELGVTTSLRPTPIERLTLVQSLGIPTVQVDYLETLDNDAGLDAIRAALAETGISITSIICGFVGDAYNDIATVRATVGLVPEATRAARLAHVAVVADFAAKLGVTRLQTHIGYVPEDHNDPQYPAVVEAMRVACKYASDHGQDFALETGQETAACLRRFIDDVAVKNLRVNFDPANMILYGNDNPIDALDVLIPYIDGIHCKDGKWPTVPGQLGREMPLGQGDVDFERWLEKLIRLGYRGPLTIEREISGEQQQRDIRTAVELIKSVLARL